MNEDNIYVWVKIWEIRIGRFRLVLEKRIVYDCVDKIWKSA